MNPTQNKPNEPAEWVDGFLFVGNHRALDLLNTRLINDDGPVELLTDLPAFERWLVAASVVSEADLNRMLQRPSAASEAERLIASVRDFRELLREAVLAFEAGDPPSPRFLSRMNELLLHYPQRFKLARKGEGLEMETTTAPGTPETFWSPLAAAAAELMTSPYPSRIRKCENCVVHFQDISKKGSRRWCSMNLCGNKLKVAAYQRRQRASRL